MYEPVLEKTNACITRSRAILVESRAVLEEAEQMCDRILQASIGHEIGDDLTALVIRREPAW